MLSYYNPVTSNESIPDGIVQKRRQIFVETSPIYRKHHIFETPTTSSDDSVHSIRRVAIREQEVPRIRVLPPPSYAKTVQNGSSTPQTPIWINSGPPEVKKSTSSLSSPSPKRKAHLITRFDRYSPSLTINVSNRKAAPNCSSSNESWSCRTDWKYFENRTPTLREARRMEHMESGNRHIPMALDNISLGSSRRTSDDHGSVASDSSQIMSMQEQIVRYSSSAAAQKSTSVEDSIMAERETALVVRLERELTEAQNCNHRLNQQIKILANSGNQAIKKELTETKRQLKERVNEVEQLRRQTAKADSDRAMWMSKQPQDVTTLQAEKQELRRQLDREQSEKQELFMQINSMIAQLADAGDQQEVDRLKLEVSSLKRELDAEKISSNAESSRLHSEVAKLKKDMETDDRVKEKMEEDIENLQRQLDIKNASIQSLMLAKSDKTASEDLEKQKVENEELRRKLANSTSDIVEKQAEIMRLKDATSVNEVTKQKLEQVQERLESVEKLLKEERSQKERLFAQTEELKSALQSSEEALSRLKSKIGEFEEDAISLRTQNTQLQALKVTSEASSSQELNEEKEKNRILEATLKEKDEKIDKIKVEVLSAESRAQQAEVDLKAMETRAQTAERKEQQLEAQLGAQGDSNEQVELLKGDLAKTEERHQLVQARLQKIEGQLKEKDGELKILIDSKAELAEQVQKGAQEKSTLNEKIGTLSLQVTTSQDKIKSLESTIDELREEIRKQDSESKMSVADEIATLMSSLTSVRQENSQYEEEVRGMQNELRTIRDELYQQQDETAQWKQRAEKAEMDIEHQAKRVEIIQSNQDTVSQRFEAEKQHFEELLEKTRQEKEEIKRESMETVSKLRSETMEASISSDREIKDLKEKIESLNRELEFSKKRVEQLQDDQLKFIGSQDEMKTELLKEVREQQDKSEEMNLELASLKSKNTSLTAEYEETTKISKHLKEKLEELQGKYDEATDELKFAEEELNRLKEMQILFGGNMESKITELQEDNKKKLDKMLEEHKKENDTLRDELKKAHTEQNSLEAVIEDQQKELVKHREETDALQDQIRSSELKLVELQKIHDAKIGEVNKSNESLINNVQDMTKLLSDETKRLEELRGDNKRLEEEVDKLRKDGSGSAELVAENARLAGELLKSHTATEKLVQQEREQVTKQFEDRLKNVTLEKTRLASDYQVAVAKLETKLDEQKMQLENQEKRRRNDLQQLELVREEMAQVRGEYEKLQANGPVAPPRSTRTISNMSAMTNWTQADFSDCEDLQRLRAEIDKQKRLIIVLRRKLQAAQSH